MTSEPEPLNPSQSIAEYLGDLSNFPLSTRPGVKAELQAARDLLNRILRLWDDDGTSKLAYRRDLLCLTLLTLQLQGEAMRWVYLGVEPKPKADALAVSIPDVRSANSKVKSSVDAWAGRVEARPDKKPHALEDPALHVGSHIILLSEAETESEAGDYAADRDEKNLQINNRRPRAEEAASEPSDTNTASASHTHKRQRLGTVREPLRERQPTPSPELHFKKRKTGANNHDASCGHLQGPEPSKPDTSTYPAVAASTRRLRSDNALDIRKSGTTTENLPHGHLLTRFPAASTTTSTLPPSTRGLRSDSHLTNRGVGPAPQPLPYAHLLESLPAKPPIRPTTFF